MIVAIDGPQSSGKTTCWQALRKSSYLGAGTVFVPEMARIVAPLFGVLEAGDWESLLSDRARLAQFFQAEYELLRQLETSSDHAVVDSSALLITAYARVFLGVEYAVPEWAKYDFIFVCEPWPAVTPDGFRFLDRSRDVAAEYSRVLTQRVLQDRVEMLPAGANRIESLVHHSIWAEFG